ncbi:MAG: D-alanine--D-alanine ligase [Planctomycetes bacterium]|nr:D-alanine--D-alanine ligase [Planctomycetota bacterium]
MTSEANESDSGIVVLAGGPGGEREGSLASGETIHQALKRAGVDNRLVIIPAEEPEEFLEGLDCCLAVIMLHGRFGEDGGAQAILERRGIPFTGSGSDACRLMMDKNATLETYRRAGLPVASWILSDNPEAAPVLVQAVGFSYPLFVKPNYGGSSVGAGRVDRPEDLPEAVVRSIGADDVAMIQECIVGRELTAAWLNGRVLPFVEMEAASGFYDYNAKYLADDTRYVCPADLPEDMAETLREQVARAAELVDARDVARIDFMLTVDGPVFLEANAIPGCTGHSLLPMAARAAGIPIEELAVMMATMAMERGGE